MTPIRELVAPSLTFDPDQATIDAFLKEWRWLLSEPIQPLLFSIFGDLFYEAPSGTVFWPNTGTAEIEHIADSKDSFRRLLGADCAEEWFLPKLVEQLRAAGKIPGPNQCYTFIIPPVFKEGRYVVDNFAVIDAKQLLRVFKRRSTPNRNAAGLSKGSVQDCALARGGAPARHRTPP